jgi:hypothetical protein
MEPTGSRVGTLVIHHRCHHPILMSNGQLQTNRTPLFFDLFFLFLTKYETMSKEVHSQKLYIAAQRDDVKTVKVIPVPQIPPFCHFYEKID